MAKEQSSSNLPPHPGAYLRTEIIAAHGLTVTAAADILGVTRAALSDLLSGKASLTVVMALRFEKAFGVSMDQLMDLQLACDIAAARARADSIQVERYTGPPPAEQPTLL